MWQKLVLIMINMSHLYSQYDFVLQVSPIYNAIILFTSRFIDALTDPIGGYLFSRYSFRWGKMKPW